MCGRCPLNDVALVSSLCLRDKSHDRLRADVCKNSDIPLSCVFSLVSLMQTSALPMVLPSPAWASALWV